MKLIKVNSKDELINLSKDLLKNVFEDKLVLIRGLETIEKDEFLCFLRTLTPGETDQDKFLFWDFGMVMELEEKRNAQNYLFSQESVPFHWDGAFHEVPKVLAFNCIESEVEGGETLFCNTEKILEDLNLDERQTLESMEAMYSTEKKAHYGGEITQRYLIDHPITGKKLIQFGESVKTKKNPVIRKVLGGSKEQYLSNKLDKMLYEKKYLYSHEWQKGDLLFADNYSLLHGRKEFSKSKGHRHLRRVQIR